MVIIILKMMKVIIVIIVIIDSRVFACAIDMQKPFERAD